MVCDKLHIICGNCGQDLTEKGMSTMEFLLCTDGFDTDDVYITCNNCNTVHRLSKYMKGEN